MIEASALRSAVREIVAETVGHRVEDSETIVSSGLIDSLSVVRLIARLEQRLNARIPPTNLQPGDFDSVDLIVGLLERGAR
jgi:acyl carrier protein